MMTLMDCNFISFCLQFLESRWGVQMFHLYGKAERCQTLPSLLKNVLFPVYKGKLFYIGTLVNVFNTAALVDHDL